MEDLKALACVACRGDTPTLSQDEVEDYLNLVEGWSSDGDTIERTFTFRNFGEALSFFNQVAEIAEAEAHHPDMSIYEWKKVKLSLTTHAAKGLTKNDFIVAAKIDSLARNKK